MTENLSRKRRPALGITIILVLTAALSVCAYHAVPSVTGRPVTGLSWEKKNASTIVLSWERTPGATGYEIRRARGSDGKMVAAARISSGRITSWEDRVDANVNRTYELIPFSGTGKSIRYGKAGRIEAGGLLGSETVGHRGAMDLAPDDTIASFEKAKELGYRVFECDLYYTRSGDLMIFHDPDLEALTGKKGPATLLSKGNHLMYPIINGKNADRYPIQYPMELKKVLTWARDAGMGLIVHIKSLDVSFDARAFRKMQKALSDTGMTDRTVFFTSSVRITEKMKSAPFRRGFLMSCTTRGQRKDAVRIAVKNGCELVILKYTDQMPINIDITSCAHDQGIRVGCYNIDRTDQLAHVKKARLDFWILNRALLPAESVHMSGFSRIYRGGRDHE